MAALATGIFNHAMTAGQALSGSSATPLASPATVTGDTSSTSGTDSSTISANDFLTLLVTEMKNQDPTATTDPNEYINQLVNVTSLEQLIDINQNLSTALGSSGSTSSSNSAGGGQVSAASSSLTRPTASSAGSPAVLSPAANRVSGNLSVPNTAPAANSVAHALDGRSNSFSKASQ